MILNPKSFPVSAKFRQLKALIPIILMGLFVSCSPAKKFAKDAKVWEKEVVALEQKDKLSDNSPNSVLFVGSSSIRLWDNIARDMAPYSVIQKGVGGARLSDILYYQNRLIKPYKVKGIVIFVANDISGSKNDRSPEQVLDLYKKLVKQIRKSHKKTPIFFVEITPTSSRWSVWPNTAKANLLIKSYSQQHKNLYFIETAGGFLGKDGKPDDGFFRSDRLHLNDLGYQTWTSFIKSSLNQNLK